MVTGHPNRPPSDSARLSSFHEKVPTGILQAGEPHPAFPWTVPVCHLVTLEPQCQQQAAGEGKPPL